MKLRAIGYTATTFEGKRYLKLNILNAVEDGRGGGDTMATVTVDANQEPKLSGVAYPVEVNVLDQAIRMVKAGDTGRQIAQVVFTEIEVGVPAFTVHDQPVRKPVQAAA